MRRFFAASVIVVLGLVHLAPLAVLIQFHVDRAYIERELCVQREVMAEMRTCHGECQLSKRFRALEQQANDEFPMERLETRFDPRTPLPENVQVVAPRAERMHHPVLVEFPIDQEVNTAEPVPWC
ncbi:MAG: hypothetical protein JNN32_05730 [Flavobacteriales bacterium]|nr:hypothetical protein [Flavobacteriales bacterium]